MPQLAVNEATEPVSAMDPGLSLLASQAAVELDNLLQHGSTRLDAVRSLGERLGKSTEAVEGTSDRRALMDLAAARPEPIPVFAEMSSTNPVFILPGALRQSGAASGLSRATRPTSRSATRAGRCSHPKGASTRARTQTPATLLRRWRASGLRTQPA